MVPFLKAVGLLQLNHPHIITTLISNSAFILLLSKRMFNSVSSQTFTPSILYPKSCVFYEELESQVKTKRERERERESRGTVNSSCWHSFCGLRNKSVLYVCSLLLLLIVFLIVYVPFQDINWSCCPYPCNNRKPINFRKQTFALFEAPFPLQIS